MSPDIANVPGGEEDRITLPCPFENSIVGRGNTKHKHPREEDKCGTGQGVAGNQRGDEQGGQWMSQAWGWGVECSRLGSISRSSKGSREALGALKGSIATI